MSLEQRELFIEREDSVLSVRRQCDLVGFNRSNVYYRCREKDVEREDHLRREIDRQYMKEACGVIKMVEYLRRIGHRVGEKLVRRLMRSMNLLAIYPHQ